MILFLFPKKIFFSISKLFVSLFNSQPSPFDKLIIIEFPALVLTIFIPLLRLEKLLFQERLLQIAMSLDLQLHLLLIMELQHQINSQNY